MICIYGSVKAQLPTNTFPSRIFNGISKIDWPITDSGTVDAVRDTFYARYPGTHIIRIQGSDTALWFYGGGRRWFRGLQATDTVSLSNRINLKLNISDTTSKWWSVNKRFVDTMYCVNDSTIGFTVNNGAQQTFKILGRTSGGGGGGSGTVTSVALSMPSAFSVTGSPITSSGTFAVSGAGTTAQYIRGNGTLATTDTAMIPNFYVKVRGLFSGTSPITFNQSTGVIGALRANTTGQLGVATFNNSDFTDNGSGLISLRGSGSSQLFGIRDSVGLQNRYINMQGFGLTVDSAGIIDLSGYVSGNLSRLILSNIATLQSSNGVISHYVNVYPDYISINTNNNTIPPKIFVQATDSLETSSPSLIAAWDSDTLKSISIADLSALIGGGGGNTNSNIGTGYRWAIPSTNNIKTYNPGYGILNDSTTVSNTITTKVDTTTIDARYPKVYNVALYGAVPDGKEKYDGAMTSGSPTLTCVSCIFTAQDVGKSIRVEGAITSGDLVTTITGFTNSSTVTLGSNATRSVTGDTLVYGTDNTAFIQQAINDAFLYGNGKVYIPGAIGFGFYVIAGPLVTSYAGANPNAQFTWPVADLGDTSFNQRKHVSIEGVLPSDNVASSLFADSLTAKYGTVLYSIIDGSGTLPSVFGTKAATIGFGNINYNEITFKNLNIFVARNKYNNGPSIGGINGFYSAATCIENITIGISGSVNRQPKPTHEIAGIVIGRKDSEIYSYIKNTSVFCMKYGFIYTEDVAVDKTIAHACIYGHTIADGNYPVVAGLMDAHWCEYSLYIPNQNLFGIMPIVTGVNNFNIQYLACELFNGSSLGAPTWLNYTYVIADSASRGRGTVSAWNIGQAEVGLNNSLFNKYGGDSIFTYQVGSRIDPNPHIWSGRTNIYGINKISGGQNGGAEQYFYNWSPLTDAAILRMQPTSGNASQGLYMSPSGTGGSSVSPLQTWLNLYNTPLWTGENTTSANTEVFQFGAAGSRYYIASAKSGTGTVRPISIETGSNTDQLKLNTDGSMTINGNQNNQLSILGDNAGRISALIRNGNAAGNTSLYLDNNRGTSSPFSAYGGIGTAGSSYSGSFFGISCPDMTFLIHDGLNGAGLLMGTLNPTPLYLGTNNTERLRINSSGSIVFNNAYSFPTSNGTDGYVLTAHTGGAATFDAPAGGITTLNTLTATTQTFATGTSGSDFNISSTTSTHTFNIPSASTSNRGLVTTTSQTFGGAKTFNDGAIVTLASASNATALVVSGNRSLATAPGASGIGLQLASFTYTNTEGATTESGGQNFHLVNTPTLTSSNAVTYSGDVSTIRFVGAPIAGGSSTISHPWNVFANDVNYFQTLSMGLNEQAGDATLGNGSIVVYTGAGGNTFTLPALATHPGKTYFIKNAGGGNLTLARSGSDNIYDVSSVTSITISAGNAVIVSAGSSFWYAQ